MGIKWYKCKCTVCNKEVHQNAFEILQPEIFVCWNCRENARQMLEFKKFAKEVKVTIDCGENVQSSSKEFEVELNLKDENVNA